MSDGANSRTRRERGIAVAMTGLVVIPLMVFAAFGVDLASWYARVSELQRGADAAALAGAVWMPSIGQATTEATNSLRSNGFVDGVDGIDIVIARGSSATALRVTVTDTDVDRFFSNVFRDGPADLTRYAEAEYNLPLPLGSPLNYFGGDSTQTQPPSVTTYAVTWPSDYATRAPANPACNVGTSSAQGAGRWSGSPASYSASGFSGSTVCVWTVTGTNSGSPASNVPPPDFFTRPPTNGGGSGCIVRTNGTGAVLGRWQSGAFASGTFSTPTTVCTFQVLNNVASSVPPFALTRVPVNGGSGYRCRVSYNTADGWWDGGTHRTTSVPVGGAAGSPAGSGSGGTGNQLCRWSADISTTVTTPPNPIPSDRSPGFWAMIYGPGQYQANGDAFSTRCLNVYNCSSVQNAQYLPTSDPNRGFWYVIDVPAGVSGTIDVNVFDASYNIGSSRLMDSTENGGSSSDADFETEFRVYRQTNPLDFTVRSPLFAGSGSQSTSNGGCWWQLRAEAGFHRQWGRLCSITGVSGGERYLVNVRTNSVGAANSAGNNGYAMEAVLNGNRYASPGPSLYAHSAMGIANQNTCTGTGCTPPPGVFYLAKVNPQYAGRTLVVELFDAGDMSGSTDAFVYPMMPSASSPRPVTPVSDLDCTWTATPDPNPTQNPSFENARTRTGVRIEPNPQSSDVSGRCGIQTSVGGTRQFNGEWLRIRVQIPPGYTCDVTINNPEVAANSCWWGIRYEFANGGASDITTWQARIEGNPLQLTQ